MKKLLTFIISVMAVLGLCSCETSDVPDGMQFVAGGEEYGYYFYAPEGWSVFSTDGVATAYVSTSNTTAINFTEIKADVIAKADDYSCGEEGCKGIGRAATEHYFLYHYFDSTTFPESMKLLEEGDITIGSDEHEADRCRYYEFSYVYNDVKYSDDGKSTVENNITRGFKQFYIVHGGSYYLMTYSAILDVPTFLTMSYYEQYKEALDSVVSNFRFVTRKAAESGESEAVTEDYRLVSDGRLSGFEFYADREFAVDFSSGIVSVSHADGSNVNMTVVTAIGTYTNVYFERRLTELYEMGATNVEVIKRAATEDAEPTADPIPSKLGQIPEGGKNSTFDYAFDLEYTYEFNGVKYHVYQVMAVSGGILTAEGYVFTYTATEENYSKHLDAVKAMRDKVNFV